MFWTNDSVGAKFWYLKWRNTFRKNWINLSSWKKFCHSREKVYLFCNEILHFFFILQNINKSKIKRLFKYLSQSSMTTYLCTLIYYCLNLNSFSHCTFPFPEWILTHFLTVHFLLQVLKFSYILLYEAQIRRWYDTKLFLQFMGTIL